MDPIVFIDGMKQEHETALLQKENDIALLFAMLRQMEAELEI